MTTDSLKANKGWDLDLKYGEKGQDQIQNVLVNSKIEVKHERDWWDKTLNICIEYESHWKDGSIHPSGVNEESCKSNYWCHAFDKKNQRVHCAILFKVSRLRKIVEKYKDRYSKFVGDGRRALCVIMPIAKLFEYETTSIETDESDDWGKNVETD